MIKKLISGVSWILLENQHNKTKMTTNTTQSAGVGYLEIILGGMYAGKTSRLIEVYKTYSYIGKKIIVINYAEDKRYDETMLSTHDGIKIPCAMTLNLYYEWTTPTSEYYDKLHSADIILINEGQFFQRLLETVLLMVEGENKVVYVCGLDGDFKREKFGELLDLIPYCDRVEKLTSLCSICRNGKRGIFSKRVTEEMAQKVIGSDNYLPVCRDCYHK